MSKNGPNVPRDGCKPPSNLVELIQINLGFEEVLKRFEGSFERDEIMAIYNVEFFFRNFIFLCNFVILKR